MTDPFDIAQPQQVPPPQVPPQPTYAPYQPPVDAQDPTWPDAAYGYYAPDPAAAVIPVRTAVPPPSILPYVSTPDAPYGRDPATGEPLSDKHKVAAAFLQLFLGWAGAGRFYIGDSKTGFTTIGLVVFAIFLSVIAFPYGWILWPALGLWYVSEFIRILSGYVKDSDGRKLR